MKEELIDKFIDALEMVYLKAQVVFSWCIISFGVSYALRNIFAHGDTFYTICFGAIAFVGYKLMLRASLDELREARNAKKQSDDE